MDFRIWRRGLKFGERISRGVEGKKSETMQEGAEIGSYNSLIRGHLFGGKQDFRTKSVSTADRQTNPVDVKNIVKNPIESYFDNYSAGPGIWKWQHYFDVYHRHFSKFIGQEVHILEVGIFSGGSLGMWKSYFGPRCKVYGVDIAEECRAYEADSIKILIGDQGNREFWKMVRAEVPRIDIVVDDGSHQTEHQIVTVEEMLPHIAPGGIYMCEDVYGLFNGFQDYVSGLSHQLNAVNDPLPGVEDRHNGMHPTSFQRIVHSIHHYPFLTVIEKTAADVAAFKAPRKGTEWQPWL